MTNQDDPSLLLSIPHSKEAEEATVGAVLINPEIFIDLHFLEIEDFYIHRNRWIWAAFKNLNDRKIPVDILTVSDELDRAGKLAELGGPAYLTTLINNVPSSLNAENYGKIVKANSTRRKYINAANEIAKVAYDQQMIIEEVEAKANNALIKINEHDTSDGEDIQDVLLRVSAQTEENNKRRKNNQPLQLGIPTGFIDLDKILQGLKPSKLFLIAGRPGMGKSSLKLCLARNTALDYGKKIAFFSVEMTNDEITNSLLSQESKIDGQRIESGAIEDDEWEIYTKAIEKLSQANIYMEDSSYLTPAILRAKCMKRKMRFGLDILFVDYIQLMAAGIKISNREQEIAYISRQLKVLAGDLKIPVIAGCQLSRASEQRSSKRPILSDLRESGTLEQDADVVAFLHRPDQYEKESKKQNITEITIAKNRKGPTGSLELIFRPTIVKFENAATKMVSFNEVDEIRDITV